MKKDKNPPICFIVTGGTIDSYYECSKDTVVPLKESVLPRYIKSLKLYNKVQFAEVCMKDSREINKADLRKILAALQKTACKKVVITHGTYTMPDTARYLKANLKRKDQTIILTGSMLPISEFTMSDGPFNLGFAVAKCQELAPGIYVSMNGKVFAPDEVMKIISRGRFTSIMGEK